MNPGRQSCAVCSRPLKTCICGYVKTVRNHVELVILQHPLEVNEAKNTGRLLHMSLRRSQLHVGEYFDETFFAAYAHASNAAFDPIPFYDLLLYPEGIEDFSAGIAKAPLLDEACFDFGDNLHKLSRLRLWVLDATWRKSRKMLYLNPALQAMPRLSLKNCPPSIYSIRKAHSENQLSTLEASCYALRQIEQNRVDYTPILDAFSAFIAAHKTFIPSR